MPKYQTMYIGKDATTGEVIETFGRLLHQLNALMNNFDSQNVRSISTDKTMVKSDDGLTEIAGNQIVMYDSNGRKRLALGYNEKTKKFEFTLANKKGVKTLYVTDLGNAVFSGTVSASDIEGCTISGSEINVDTDINVGNNIYIGNDSDDDKKIHFFQSDDSSFITQAYISANKDDITDMTIMAGNIIFSTLNDIRVKRGLGEYKVVTTNMAPYVEIDGVKHYLKWE